MAVHDLRWLRRGVQGKAGGVVICQPCATAADNKEPHDDCPGGNWCDCQHMGAPPFRHASGQPCYGCQICIVVDEEWDECE